MEPRLVRLCNDLFSSEPIEPTPYGTYFPRCPVRPRNQLATRALLEDLVLQPASTILFRRTEDRNLLFMWFANYWVHLFLGTDPVDRTRQSKRIFSVTSIYGSREDQQLLRTFRGGQVRLEDGFAPPYSFLGATNAAQPDAFVPGLHQNQIGLAVLHTLVLREHNRVCLILQHTYPTWGEQALFDMACRWTLGYIMGLVKTEFLSTLAGRRSPHDLLRSLETRCKCGDTSRH